MQIISNSLKRKRESGERNQRESCVTWLACQPGCILLSVFAVWRMGRKFWTPQQSGFHYLKGIFLLHTHFCCWIFLSVFLTCLSFSSRKVNAAACPVANGQSKETEGEYERLCFRLVLCQTSSPSSAIPKSLVGHSWTPFPTSCI